MFGETPFGKGRFIPEEAWPGADQSEGKHEPKSLDELSPRDRKAIMRGKGPLSKGAQTGVLPDDVRGKIMSRAAAAEDALIQQIDDERMGITAADEGEGEAQLRQQDVDDGKAKTEEEREAEVMGRHLAQSADILAEEAEQGLAEEQASLEEARLKGEIEPHEELSQPSQATASRGLLNKHGRPKLAHGKRGRPPLYKDRPTHRPPEEPTR